MATSNCRFVIGIYSGKTDNSSSFAIGGFIRVLRFPPPIKTDSHDITEILLKVALNTINHPHKIEW
jgi:hypothetical protein